LTKRYRTSFYRELQSGIPFSAKQNQKFFSWAAGLPYKAKIELREQREKEHEREIGFEKTGFIDY